MLTQLAAGQSVRSIVSDYRAQIGCVCGVDGRSGWLAGGEQSEPWADSAMRTPWLVVGGAVTVCCHCCRPSHAVTAV